jgi:hypothetical protein
MERNNVESNNEKPAQQSQTNRNMVFAFALVALWALVALGLHYKII